MGLECMKGSRNLQKIKLETDQVYPGSSSLSYRQQIEVYPPVLQTRVACTMAWSCSHKTGHHHTPAIVCKCARKQFEMCCCIPHCFALHYRHSGSIVERRLCELEVVVSIPGQIIPNTFKMILAAQHEESRAGNLNWLTRYQ